MMMNSKRATAQVDVPSRAERSDSVTTELSAALDASGTQVVVSYNNSRPARSYNLYLHRPGIDGVGELVSSGADLPASGNMTIAVPLDMRETGGTLRLELEIDPA